MFLSSLESLTQETHRNPGPKCNRASKASHDLTADIQNRRSLRNSRRKGETDADSGTSRISQCLPQLHMQEAHGHSKQKQPVRRAAPKHLATWYSSQPGRIKQHNTSKACMQDPMASLPPPRPLLGRTTTESRRLSRKTATTHMPLTIPAASPAASLHGCLHAVMLSHEWDICVDIESVNPFRHICQPVCATAAHLIQQQQGACAHPRCCAGRALLLAHRCTEVLQASRRPCGESAKPGRQARSPGQACNGFANPGRQACSPGQACNGFAPCSAARLAARRCRAPRRMRSKPHAHATHPTHRFRTTAHQQQSTNLLYNGTY